MRFKMLNLVKLTFHVVEAPQSAQRHKRLCSAHIAFNEAWNIKRIISKNRLSNFLKQRWANAEAHKKKRKRLKAFQSWERLQLSCLALFTSSPPPTPVSPLVFAWFHIVCDRCYTIWPHLKLSGYISGCPDAFSSLVFRRHWPKIFQMDPNLSGATLPPAVLGLCILSLSSNLGPTTNLILKVCHMLASIDLPVCAPVYFSPW